MKMQPLKSLLQITLNFNQTNLEITMSISDLTHQRLRIALNSIERDSEVPQSIRSGFKTLYECVYEQKLATEIIESELMNKAGSVELNYCLSQKLSVGQFLKYFQKIQKVMENVDSHNAIDQNQIQQCVSQRCQQIDQTMEKYRKKNQEMGVTLQRQLKGLNKDIQIIKSRLVGLQRGNQNPKQLIAQKSVISEFLQELKVIQQYCEENKSNLVQLISNNKTKDKLVSFSDLRSILSNLENSLNQSVHHYVSRGFTPSISKLRWKYTDGNCIFKGDSGKFQTVLNGGVIIQESGIYEITCGFFPTQQGELELQIDNTVVANYYCSQLPKQNICRTIMLFIYIEKDSRMDIFCSCPQAVQGFLCLHKF